MPTKTHVGVAPDKHASRRILPTRLTAAYRLLGERYLAMPGDDRSDLAQPWRFANFATADRRYDPILGLLVACADCAHDPRRRPAVREFADEFRDALYALCAPAEPIDFVETLHGETRAQSVADPVQSELTAHPECPTRLQRWIIVATHHRAKLNHSIVNTRQKLGRMLAARGSVA